MSEKIDKREKGRKTEGKKRGTKIRGKRNGRERRKPPGKFATAAAGQCDTLVFHTSPCDGFKKKQEVKMARRGKWMGSFFSIAAHLPGRIG